MVFGKQPLCAYIAKDKDSVIVVVVVCSNLSLNVGVFHPNEAFTQIFTQFGVKVRVRAGDALTIAQRTKTKQPLSLFILPISLQLRSWSTRLP